MSFRRKLTEIISRTMKAEDKTLQVMDFFEDEGLGLVGNGWYDDEEFQNGLNSLIMLKGETAEQIALYILINLEEKGFSLIGNGWLEDDLIAEEYVQAALSS